MAHEGGIASWWKGAKCNRKAAFGASTWGFPERLPDSTREMGFSNWILLILSLEAGFGDARVCSEPCIKALTVPDTLMHITALSKNSSSSQGHFPRVAAMNRMMSECVTHVALVFRPVAECLESALTFETKKRLAVGRCLFILIMLDQRWHAAVALKGQFT